MWPVTSANDVTDEYGSPDSPGGDRLIGFGSQILGTQQDRTVTQSRFSGLPDDEYPDGTVLIWRFEDTPAAYAMRDDKLAEVVGYGPAHWWTPKGAAEWTHLVQLALGSREPIVLHAWGETAGGTTS